MPLTGDVSQNIHELEHHGTRPRSHKQIVAIAIHAASKKGKFSRALEEYAAKQGKKRLKDKTVTEPIKTKGIIQEEPVRLSYESLREAISKAAERVHLSPSEKQRKAGNYRMGHVTIQGMDITIENPVGSVRKGKTWETTMKNHYGYIKRTESEADGDHIDVFVGPCPESEVVFVIDQQVGGKFDEHKCMVGFTNAQEAKKAYHDNYSEGWEGFRDMRALTIDQFKHWIKKGNTHLPIARQVLTFNSEPVKLAMPSLRGGLGEQTGLTQGLGSLSDLKARLTAAKPKTPRPLPAWVPREDPEKPETTGFVPVQSSWIAGVKYTPERGAEMTVKKGGKNYPYAGLNLEMFRRWIAAKSPGKWWWRNIGYPMKDAHQLSRDGVPLQLSVFTGKVHPIFQDPKIDGPVEYSPFTFHRNKYSPELVMDWLRRHVHPQITPQHLAAMIGWMPGTKTSVYGEGPIGYKHRFETELGKAEPTSLTFSTHAPGYNVSRGFYSRQIMPHGGAELHNEHMIVPKVVRGADDTYPNPYRGLSAPSLLRQARAAYEMGIPQIKWFSAWDPPEARTGAINDFIGGLHWPFIGANGFVPNTDTIPEDVRSEADAASNGMFSKFQTFEHFFKSPKARYWYEFNPSGHNSWVDTTPGSYSRTILERHVGENAARHGMEGPIPDAHMLQKPLPRNAAEAKMQDYENDEEPAPSRLQKLLFSMFHGGREPRHPGIEHLIATGSCHPEHFDEYFNK